MANKSAVKRTGTTCTTLCFETSKAGQKSVKLVAGERVAGLGHLGYESHA
jgi:hypothetical protein